MTAEPIYLDHQATTPVDPRVVEAMSRYWNMEFGNPHSSKHAFGWRAEEAVEQGRRAVADLISADADEIVFTSGATEANNLAILGLLGHGGVARTRVVVSAIEHKCVLESSRQLSRIGYEVVFAPALRSGHIDIEALNDVIDDNTALLSVMLVNNEIGSIQPLEQIADMCRRCGVLLHCDAAQAATGLKIDVNRLGVDLLSLSSHKMYGPKGVGALFVSQTIRSQLRPIIHGGGQEGGLRSGTLPVPLCVGFGVAARLLCDQLPHDLSVLDANRDVFLQALSAKMPDFKINGDAPRHPGTFEYKVRWNRCGDLDHKFAADPRDIDRRRLRVRHSRAVSRHAGDWIDSTGSERVCSYRLRAIHERRTSAASCSTACRSSARSVMFAAMSHGRTASPGLSAETVRYRNLGPCAFLVRFRTPNSRRSIMFQSRGQTHRMR